MATERLFAHLKHKPYALTSRSRRLPFRLSVAEWERGTFSFLTGRGSTGLQPLIEQKHL